MRQEKLSSYPRTRSPHDVSQPSPCAPQQSLCAPVSPCAAQANFMQMDLLPANTNRPCC